MLYRRYPACKAIHSNPQVHAPAPMPDAGGNPFANGISPANKTLARLQTAVAWVGEDGPAVAANIRRPKSSGAHFETTDAPRIHCPASLPMQVDVHRLSRAAEFSSLFHLAFGLM